jgi:hypothetical protein
VLSACPSSSGVIFGADGLASVSKPRKVGVKYPRPAFDHEHEEARQRQERSTGPAPAVAGSSSEAQSRGVATVASPDPRSPLSDSRPSSMAARVAAATASDRACSTANSIVKEQIVHIALLAPAQAVTMLNQISKVSSRPTNSESFLSSPVSFALCSSWTRPAASANVGTPFSPCDALREGPSQNAPPCRWPVPPRELRQA